MHPIIIKQRRYFQTQETKSLKFRIDNLRKLKQIIKKNETQIIFALNKDLNKSKYEAYITEIGIIYEEINYYIKYLPKWIKAKKVKTPIFYFKSKSYIISEPYGVTLIISPWNYPFQLAIAPLIGAIAGGNTVIIKPSEYSTNTTKILEKIINNNFSEEYINVITGNALETEALLKERFDYIFFTGSVNVGKLIMEKASHHLTPVTLELGGKSPCIVFKDANLDLAAKRIVFGKLLNAGQTCVAPDYLLVQNSVKKVLVTKIIEYIKYFYGDDYLKNLDYPKIINKKHFFRLINLVENKTVLYGGLYDEAHLKIEPTLIENLSEDDKLMTEEIFGPVLPIIEFANLHEAILTVKTKPKPLALYLFTKDKKIEEKVFGTLSFGGGCVNDTIIHLATPFLPFGGIGESGIGSYHGKASYTTFTHQKSILKKGIIDIKFRYPPYNNKKFNLIKKIMK